MEPPSSSSEPPPLPTPSSELPLPLETSPEAPPPPVSKPEPPHPAVPTEQLPLQNPNPNQILMPRVPNYPQQTQRPHPIMQPPPPFSSAFRSSSTPNNNNFSSSQFANSHRPHPIPADSNSPQVRQPVNVQTIGMIGSLSIAPTGNQMRPGGALSQNQQRLGQPSLARPPNPSSNQPLNTQRLSGHPAARGQTISSSNSQLPTSHNPHPLHQQFIQSHQKQTNPNLMYRPQMRPPTIQQRPQHQIPLSSQQQKQQQQFILQHTPSTSLSNQPQEHHPPRNVQSISQNQRSLTSITPNANAPASAPPGLNNDADESSNDIVGRKRIREMVMQVDQSETLRPEIEDDLIEIADDFVESIVTAACQLAKHRKSATLEAKDILLHVERHWGITPPGFSGEEIKCYKKPSTNDIHKERLAMIKKSIAGSHDNTRTLAAGQAAANPKTNSSKNPATGSPK